MKKLFIFLTLMFVASPAFAVSKYWVGGGSSTNWSATSNTNWSNTDGGANNATVPAAGDDVFMKSSADCVMNTNSNALKSFDMTGYTGTFSGSSNVVVRGADSTTVAIKFAGTVTWTGLVSITTGGTARVYNLTSGGKTLTDLTMNATSGGTLSLQDDWTGTSTFTITNGTVNTNGHGMSVASFSSSSNNTRAFNFTNSLIDITGTGTVWNMATTTAMTFTSTGSTVRFTDTSSSTKAINIANTAGSGIAFNAISITGGGTGALTFNADGSSAVNFTINPPKTVKWTAGTTFTVSGAFTATGTSGNLITLSSSSNTSTAVLTLNGTIPSPDYWSIRDLDNRGSTGLTNIGNNSQGTLSAANVNGFFSTKTISNTGGNFNATAAWTPAIVPSSIDKVVATGTSGNLAVNVASNCFSFDLTGYVGTLSGSSALTVNANTGGTHNVYFAGTVTYSGSLSMIPPLGTTVNLTTNGKTLGAVTAGNSTGLISMQDNLSMSLSALTVSAQLNTNGYSITCGSISYPASNFDFTNSTISISGSAGTPWSNTSSGTMTSTGSTITLTDTGAGAKTFAGNGKTYNTVNITGGGAGAWTFTGANTFANFPQVTGGTKTLTFPSSTTTTFTGGTDFGNGSNLITINSSTAGTRATFSKTSGTVSCNYITLKDIAATGGALWYAGVNSNDLGNNTGWIFNHGYSNVNLFNQKDF